MEVGRELKNLLRDGVAALERSADASERLLELAKEEQIVMAEAGPPVCPHCGTLNPEVTQLDGGGSGPLGEFFFTGETHCCNKPIFAVAHGWDTFPNRDLAVAWANETKGGNR